MPASGEAGRFTVMTSAEGEARRALGRLRRSVEKAGRELGVLRGALERAEADDFPADEYEGASRRLDALGEWLNHEEARLRAKVLQAGGLEPGRVRRR